MLNKTEKKIANGGSILTDSRIKFLKLSYYKTLIQRLCNQEKDKIKNTHKKLKYVGHE